MTMDESLTGRLISDITLTGSLSPDVVLGGSLSSQGVLTGSLSASGTQVPYYEVTNNAGGITAYIGNEV